MLAKAQRGFFITAEELKRLEAENDSLKVVASLDTPLRVRDIATRQIVTVDIVNYIARWVRFRHPNSGAWCTRNFDEVAVIGGN